PGAQDAEEDIVADLLAQRLQGHRAAIVDGRVEELGRAWEGGQCGEPEVLTGVGILGDRVEGGEARGRSRAAVALGPDPLGPGCEALVEPDIRPDLERDRVA